MDTNYRARRRDVIDPLDPAVQEAASVILAAWIRGDPAECAWVTRQLAAAAAMRWASDPPMENRAVCDVTHTMQTPATLYRRRGAGICPVSRENAALSGDA